MLIGWALGIYETFSIWEDASDGSGILRNILGFSEWQNSKKK